jgi:endonuclease/exonuclease/phosphatase (EEP) superfamily protein YafD
MRERSQDLPVVMAGDFNARPHELGRLSNPGQGGFHTDVDHADHEPTFYQRKIDYIFLPDGHFSDLSGEVRPSRWSDHRILFGQATFGR